MKLSRFEKINELLNRRQPDLTILMDEVHKPQNLAAVIRTADAVGIGKVHAVWPKSEIASHHHTSGGSANWVKVDVHKCRSQAINQLKQDGMQVLAAHLSDNAVDFREVDYTKPTAILLGNEKQGVSAQASELADQHVVIPMHGMVQSLNVSVANAIILYEAQRQRQQAGMYQSCRLHDSVKQRLIFEWMYPSVRDFCRRHQIRYPNLDENGYMDDEHWMELRKTVG
jgi:tRNA (guanosine-2'-O-)-methyltransferase